MATVDLRHGRGGSDDDTNKQESDDEDSHSKQEEWISRYPNQLSLPLRAPYSHHLYASSNSRIFKHTGARTGLFGNHAADASSTRSLRARENVLVAGSNV